MSVPGATPNPSEGSPNRSTIAARRRTSRLAIGSICFTTLVQIAILAWAIFYFLTYPNTTGDNLATKLEFVFFWVGFFMLIVRYSLVIVPIIGVILGHVALVQITRNPQYLRGRGLAIASLALGYLGAICLIGAAIYAKVVFANWHFVF